MCVNTVDLEKCKMLNRKTLGRAVGGVLSKAHCERRLICGLLNAILYLEENPMDALLCIVPQSTPGDAASHMQTVLLQAFCYENCIPVIQVDSSEILAEYCGLMKPCSSRKGKKFNCECVIVTRDTTIPWNEEEDPPLSDSEQQLNDFYLCTIEEYPRPIIQLPR